MTTSSNGDYIPINVEGYHRRDIIDRENAVLWPKVWLIACRVEELEKPGDFVTFDVGNESFLLVSTQEGIKVYFNVCQHRGRRLKGGCGNTGKHIRCPFHGWRWDLDGRIAHVTDEDDWQGSANCEKENLALQEVRFQLWGGWVWITMDPDIEPLLEYLGPIPDIFKHHELDKCRRTWHQTVVFPANWKLALDAFNEGYHVEATHSQIARYGRPKSLSKAFGKHGWFGYPGYMQKATTQGDIRIDYRKLLIQREHERDEWLHALVSEYALRAVDRLLDEVPEWAPYSEVVAAYARMHREEAIKAGAPWPMQLTGEDMERAGTCWHVFPNTIFLPSVDGALWYRARPNGDDPDTCLYDIWWLQRYAPGEEPTVTNEFYPTVESFKGKNPFLEQDFSNLAAVQQGVKSRGFKGARTSPVQEVAISNFHQTLATYLDSGTL
ncbi:aromatic ring-hydroxylating oxygenase subunit alpha [Pseudomonas sp. NFX224]|uniref:aromatic ring-hydroxylating oxygenase subunit alpha n=1 Tax=Pseudomonas sp. NFX224 TaxID=3402862 RepID=UPI003AFA9F29